MSILARLNAQAASGPKKLFCVVAGPRLGGKTTLAGTLPGATLLLQAAVLESGCESARQLSASYDDGRTLDVLSFESVEELLTICEEASDDKTYDHIYVDGLSAITELKYAEPRIKALLKKDNWAAFREIGEAASESLEALKRLTYGADGKNVFVTIALRIEQKSATAPVDVILEAKGQVAVTAVTKLGEAVVTILPPMQTEAGETPYRLLTKNEDNWPGRVDGLLAHQNPGVLEPADLGALLKLTRGAASYPRTA